METILFTIGKLAGFLANNPPILFMLILFGVYRYAKACNLKAPTEKKTVAQKGAEKYDESNKAMREAADMMRTGIPIAPK